MTRLPVILVCVLLLGLLAMIPSFAKAPEELKKSPVADLAAEANEQIKSLEKWMASEATFKEKKDDIRRSASVIAVLGQAMAKHPEGKSEKVSPIALRDAALKLSSSEDHPAAVEALKTLKAASQGQASAVDADEIAWKDLIDMADLMHVVNARNAQVIRAARRSRDPEGDSRHALTVAMLTIAMSDQADNYLTDEAEIKAWKKYAHDFQVGMTDLASAIKAQDKANVQKHLAAATKACNDCHAQFRPEPKTE